VDPNAFVTGWLAEESPLAAARSRAVEVGVTSVTPAAGSMLRWLAASVSARTVVETGTGTGVSGLWLLAGMQAGGTLTSVDIEPEHQRLARSAFTEAGVPASRTRLITGNALDVLPRLADHGYDLAFIDAAPLDHADQLQQAWRLVRPGGVVVVSGWLRSTGGRDAEATAATELLDAVRADDRLKPAMLPVGDGLLILTAPV
jgi:predicted O-methyltransferase YrrM